MNGQLLVGVYDNFVGPFLDQYRRVSTYQDVALYSTTNVFVRYAHTVFSRDKP